MPLLPLSLLASHSWVAPGPDREALIICVLIGVLLLSAVFLTVAPLPMLDDLEAKIKMTKKDQPEILKQLTEQQAAKQARLSDKAISLALARGRAGCGKSKARAQQDAPSVEDDKAERPSTDEASIVPIVADVQSAAERTQTCTCLCPAERASVAPPADGLFCKQCGDEAIDGECEVCETNRIAVGEPGERS